MGKVNQPTPDPIYLTEEIWNQMMETVKRLDPIEACGLLCGKNHTVSSLISVTNTLQSTTRYKMDPQEQLDAFNFMEEHGLELLGIFHSHPNGPETPSPSDIDQAYYPDAANLIWFKRYGKWACRAYYIKSGAVNETEIIFSY